MEQDTFELINAIREAQSAIINAIEFHTHALTTPYAIFKPKLSLDGDMWCALYGKNLQCGIAGFGSSPQLAIDDFNFQFSVKYSIKEKQ